MLQIILTLAIFLILVIPMGKYMYHIATEQKTFADKVFNPIDHLIYKICGIKMCIRDRPKTSSKKLPDGRMISAPLEDMYPFLSREELEENMYIPLPERG